MTLKGFYLASERTAERRELWMSEYLDIKRARKEAEAVLR